MIKNIIYFLKKSCYYYYRIITNLTTKPQIRLLCCLIVNS